MDFDSIDKLAAEIAHVAWVASGDDPAVAGENIRTILASLISYLADTALGEKPEDVAFDVRKIVSED